MLGCISKEDKATAKTLNRTLQQYASRCYELSK